MSIDFNQVELNVMNPSSDKKKFKWLTVADKQKYPYHFIVKKVGPPNRCSGRAEFFTFDGF